MNLVEEITKNQIRTDLPAFQVGDTINVGVKIKEKTGTKERERVQDYEGIVVAIQGSGIGKTFTVRKVSSGVGVERIFPMNSPVIDTITVVRKGKVRRAKLNYLRTRVKKTKIKERN